MKHSQRLKHNSNEIAKGFDHFQHLSRHKVFDDFLTLCLCTFHRTNLMTGMLAKDEENEKLYSETIKGYSQKDLEVFTKILASFMEYIWHNPYTDPLGEYYEEYFADERLGQFFTPMEICKLMVMLQGADKETTGQKVNDPAVGSGRTLIAYAEQAPNNIFVGCDLNQTTAKLCALNFFINGMKGEVCNGDTLRLQYFRVWQINMNGLGIWRLLKKPYNN
jgi:type I restriction-modification system DNA methylase subunit